MDASYRLEMFISEHIAVEEVIIQSEGILTILPGLSWASVFLPLLSSCPKLWQLWALETPGGSTLHLRQGHGKVPQPLHQFYGWPPFPGAQFLFQPCVLTSSSADAGGSWRLLCWHNISKQLPGIQLVRPLCQRPGTWRHGSSTEAKSHKLWEPSDQEVWVGFLSRGWGICSSCCWTLSNSCNTQLFQNSKSSAPFCSV